MRIVTIGTGCARPSLARGGNSILIEAGGLNIVVDLGLGSLHGLLRQGLPHAEIDCLVLTHFHTDHTAELPSFLFAANYDETPRKTPLTIIGGPGLGCFMDALEGLYGNWMAAKGYPREIIEAKLGATLAVGPVLASAGPASHDPSSLSWRFSHGGVSCVITGDTGPDPSLAAFASGADLLIAEASLPHDRPAPYHLRAEDAALIARDSGVGALALTHFYPASEADGPLARAKAAFAGHVSLAVDGTEFILPLGDALFTNDALGLYRKMAEGLNGFFSRTLGPYCADCLGFHRQFAPEDAIARHRLVSGQFPGCCQEGVADSAHIPGVADNRFSHALMEEIRSARPPWPANVDTAYIVEDSRHETKHEGKGCVWLSPGGCVLGSLKSPICLAYICPPIIAELSARAGRPLEGEFEAIAQALAKVSLGAQTGGEAMQEAEKTVEELLSTLGGLERELVGG